MTRPKHPPSFPDRALLVATLVLLIIVAHIFLWRSDMPTGLKLAFTIRDLPPVVPRS